MGWLSLGIAFALSWGFSFGLGVRGCLDYVSNVTRFVLAVKEKDKLF
tara:strand:- start:713 stop:853 length:141 start_codon:yes stop_codon:yes gene_type:complete